MPAVGKETRDNHTKTLCALRALKPEELLDVLDKVLEEESVKPNYCIPNSQTSHNDSVGPA